MKKVLKWLVVCLLTPILLFILLVGLLYLPPIQKWAVDKAAQYASEEMGMQVTIDEVRLAFPLDLRLGGVLAVRPNDSIAHRTDTIAKIEDVQVSVQLMPLFSNRVEVDALTFKNMKANTDRFIGDLRIKGHLERLHLVSHAVHLKGDSARINLAQIEGANLDIALGDTVPEDPNKKNPLWKINIDQLQLSHSHLALHMPGDTMSIKAYFGDAVAKQAFLDLYTNSYQVAALDWHKGAFHFDQNYVPKARKGFDGSHLALSDLNLGLDTFRYAAPEIAMKIRAANFKEQSGLVVKAMQSNFRMDSTTLYLHDLHLKLPFSQIDGRLQMNMNAFADRNPGKIDAQMVGAVSKADLRPFLTALPAHLYNAFPAKPLQFQGSLQGNMQYARFKRLRLSMADMFDFTGSGWVANLLRPDRLRANIDIKGKAHNLDFATQLMPKDVAKQVRLPRQLGIDGKVQLRENQYLADLFLFDPNGKVKLEAFYHTRSEQYSLTAKADKFPLQKFLPTLGVSPFTGSISAKGQGTDVLNGRAAANLSADIVKFSYGNYDLDRLKAKVSMRKGNLSATVNSQNPMLAGQFSYHGALERNHVKGNLKGNFQRIDLKKLGVMAEPLVASGWVDLAVQSDMKAKHFVKGPIKDLLVQSEGKNGKTKLVEGAFDLIAAVNGDKADAHFVGQITEARPKALGLVDKDYVVSSEANLSISVHGKELYSIRGDIANAHINEIRNGAFVPLLVTSLSVQASMVGKQIDADVVGPIDFIDLYNLGMVEKPFTTRFHSDLTLSTDGGENLTVKGILGDLRAKTTGKTFAPGDVSIDIVSRKDTTNVDIVGGDFMIDSHFDGSYLQLMNTGKLIAKDLSKQIDNKYIDHQAIQRLLPTGIFVLKSGKDNLFSHILAQKGISFGSADINLTSSPENGINGDIWVDKIIYDSLRVDTLNMRLRTDEQGLNYALHMKNTTNSSYPYNAEIKGLLYSEGLKTQLTLNDRKNRPAIQLAAQVGMGKDGIEMKFTSPTIILGYETFGVNANNYLSFDKNKRISADLALTSDKGAGLMVTTEDSDSTATQNITFNFNSFELGKISSVLPFIPHVSGEMNGECNIVQRTDHLNITADVGINNLVYENNPMGNVSLTLAYYPLENGEHMIGAYIAKDNYKVGELMGTYSNKNGGTFDTNFTLDKFPLSYVNGFIPDQIIGFDGDTEGTLSIKGTLDKLDVNGELYLDSTKIFSLPYGVEMHFANDPIRIENSRIEFENFEVYSNNDSPLLMHGYLDFSDMNKMNMDVQMRARNFAIIDAKENPRSEVYGKVFVNFDGRMRGLVNQLQLRGKLDVLGNTDVTYILRNETLATDTELNDLVQFVNLNDSTPISVKRPDINGFNMRLAVDVDEQAHLVCALNADKSNYVDLYGGGVLQLSYDPANSVRVRGRYTLNSGQMKYSLPVIPLRTFSIKESSYIEFSGDPMQPLLHIEATERLRSSVTDNNGQGRLVDFLCGVRLSNRFPKPGIEFIIEAPEDQEMQNILSTKSVEDRSKLAVTMLASGMYFDGGNSQNAHVAMNGALAGFLQSQVNAITGKALNSMGLDLTANMESTADANGTLHTDYTFKFSKRLWDNRLRIIMGGRVSTGSQYAEQNGAFFDNLSVEYRLDKKETKYLKLYYEREAYDWLEGEQSEFGIGFMWKRKLRTFRDIFRFKNEDDSNLVLPKSSATRGKDSLVNFINETKNEKK